MFSAHLSSHPARKFVMDFLRMIIVDSLMRPQSSRSAVVIDLVLEATPEHATRQQRQEFQTEVLKSLMDHLLAADALLGEEAALPLSTGSNYSNIVANIFNLTSRIVDKLWQGAYLRESKEVFEFIIKLISQAKRKSSGVSLDTIYRCLNRTILYQLSRPMHTVADQTNLLDALHKLTSNRSLVFGPGNYDQEFIGCLCYCLLQLAEDPNNISDPPLLRMTTWHIDREMDSGDRAVDSDEGGAAGPQYAPCGAGGTHLLATAASRVWEELYIGKKPAIEEQFKVTLTNTDPNCSQMTTPELHAVRGLIQEPACKVWVVYYENERKCYNSYSEKLPSQIHSKLQKVGHGVLRLASRRSKRDLPTRISPASVQDFTAWTANHVSIVKDLIEYQHQQYLQNSRHTEKYLMEEWAQTETELMRERGIWGPPVGSDLDKWMLDMTEGPHRMRKKMIHNDLFYLHYPYHHEKDSDKPKRSKSALSHHSRRYFERYRSHSLVSDEAMPRGLSAEHSQDALQDTAALNEDVFVEQKAPEIPTPSLLPRLLPGKTSHLDNDADDEQEGESVAATEDIDVPSEGKTDNQMLLKLLEEGEKITHMFRCARIEGLDTVEGLEGLLLFGKEHFYVVDGFVLLRSMEIVDIDTLPADLHDPIIPSTTKTNPGLQKRKCLKFVYEEIREVHKRRYLLQPIAIEVFSVDGRNFLLAFPKKVRNKVHARFLAVATAITDSALESVSGQKQNAKVEPGTSLISNLIGGEVCHRQMGERRGQ
ncbi:WD repeat and FYVE domain-containing protein 3 [Lamellibrachia satsuma]|nr:WD repeat and FYVE domain-containing protein 3 [Lamellibrachia satsuma]